MALEEVKIRSFHRERDLARVESFERRCEVGSKESSLLVVNTMGDPLCRIKNSPQHTLLVAEVGDEIVGIIGGTIKMVIVNTCDSFAKVGYILNLRVSPIYRRRGIGASLVQALETWFRANHVDYAYMATEKDNRASLNLFMDKFSFVKFRSPAILVNSVNNKLLLISPSVKIMKISVEQAECLYKTFMGSIEFFPHDIDKVLRNKLSLGTWVAYPKEESWNHHHQQGKMLPRSWAMLSVWNTSESFKLEVGRAAHTCISHIKIHNFVSKAIPCLGMQKIPDVSTYFGFYFMYGLLGNGPQAGKLVQSLCKFVHNMAANQCKNCRFIVTEVGKGDILIKYIPHKKILSSFGDVWCIKALRKNEVMRNGSQLVEWTKVEGNNSSLFVDPREV